MELTRMLCKDREDGCASPERHLHIGSRYTTKCLRCGAVSIREEDKHTVIALAVQEDGAQSLESVMASHLGEEKLCEVVCSATSCGNTAGEFTRCLERTQTGEHLMVHLNRFTHTGTGGSFRMQKNTHCSPLKIFFIKNPVHLIRSRCDL